MTEPYKHLSKGAYEVLNKSPQERINWFTQDRWIEHDGAKVVIARITELIHHEKIARMPSLLVVGETNSGKSSIIARIAELNPPYETNRGLVVPVLKVQAPSIPDELRLYNNLLESLMIPFNPSDNIRRREPQVHGILNELQVKVLMIDELNNSLAGTIPRQRQFFNALRTLSNQLRISIVAAGTREAARALAVDNQLANRFDPVTLPQWKCDAAWQRLVVSFERLVPLPEPSNLALPDTAAKLYELTEGWIGELKKLLLVCLKEAIRQGKSKIDSTVIVATKFVPPSKRRAAAESRE